SVSLPIYRSFPTRRSSDLEIRSTGRTLAVGFLNREPDVAPAAPFIMPRALFIAASGFSIVRVRARDEFWKRGVHLHVVRDKQSRSEEHTSELQSLAYLVCR